MGRDASHQLGDRGTGIEVRLVPEKEAARKAAGEVGLQCADGVGVERLEVRGGAAEAGKFLQVARGGDQQRAIGQRDRHLGAPIVERLPAQRDDQRLTGGFLLAPGGDHAAGVERTAAPRLGLPLDERDVTSRAQKSVGGGEAGDAGAEDRDGRGQARRLFGAGVGAMAGAGPAMPSLRQCELVQVQRVAGQTGLSAPGGAPLGCPKSGIAGREGQAGEGWRRITATSTRLARGGPCKT